MHTQGTIRYVELAALTPESAPAVFVERFDGWTMSEPGEDPPHRHDYHEVLWFESGFGSHRVDERAVEIRPHTLSLIARGQVHTFAETRRLTGYVVCFTDDFLKDGAHTTLFNYLGTDPAVAIPPAERREGVRLLAMILREYESPEGLGRLRMLRHLIQALLVRLERVRQLSLSAAPGDEASQRVYREFTELLEQNFTLHHDVAHYASLLHRTPGQLSRAVQQAVGKPAKRVILERLALEAKRLLQYSDSSVKQVAFRLGFSDPFHLSKAFKGVTGLSPMEYRRARRGG